MFINALRVLIMSFMLMYRVVKCVPGSKNDSWTVLKSFIALGFGG
jgi:hypothetical protein